MTTFLPSDGKNDNSKLKLHHSERNPFGRLEKLLVDWKNFPQSCGF